MVVVEQIDAEYLLETVDALADRDGGFDGADEKIQTMALVSYLKWT